MRVVQLNWSTLVDRVDYLRRSLGVWGTFRRLVALGMRPIIRIDRCHLMIRELDSEIASVREGSIEDERGAQAIDVSSPLELETFRTEFVDYFDYDKCRAFLQGDHKRIISIVRMPSQNDRWRIVAVRTMERGVFSIWNGKIHLELPDDHIMIHEHEVHPIYRGQWFSGLIDRLPPQDDLRAMIGASPPSPHSTQVR